MLRTICGSIKPRWKQVISCLLAVIVIAGLLPAAANAAEVTHAASTAAGTLSAPIYESTGSFETNIAGATGWNGTRLPLPVYDAETGGKQILTVPASDGGTPIPFALLEYNGGSRVKIGLATGSDGGVTAWRGGRFAKTGWVDKELIFVNLPDLLPSVAYNLTNSTGSIFRAVDGMEIPNVTGKRFYQAKRQFSERLNRYEFIVPCMFTLAERLAKVQAAAMSNGDTLVIYETFRPASVQSAVRDSFGSLWDNNSAVSADMNKAIAMGYARSQGWFISGGTSNHQAGLAVDMSLAKGDPAELHEYELGGVTYRKYESWTEYEMPTQMHELSSAAIRYKAPVSSYVMPAALDNWTEQFTTSEGAKRLQRYCTDAGLIPLASEWWHFNDPNLCKIMAKGSYAGQSAINTKGNYSIDRAYSTAPYTALTELSGVNTISSPVMAIASSNGDTGGLNPGSAGGQKPSTSNVAWTTDPKRTFLRFSLIELPQGAETDLSASGSWRLVGHPLNVVWGKGTYETWNASQCRSNILWYNSTAMQFNEKGSSAPQLMAGTVYAYDATAGTNQRWVTTADEFQQEAGITDQQKEQMFNLNSSSWSSGWVNGDYTSMWGSDPHPVTDGNLYNVYKANDAFVYLLTRLSETTGAGSGWSKEEALDKWSEFTYNSSGELRTKYRVIIETGGIFVDPDGVRRAYTLREMMAYSLYNNESVQRNNLIWDQASTIKNMAQWMRQAKDDQFLEYPLDEGGTPTGEELHSTNGFRETDSYVDSITSAVKIRDTIFSERRSFGLHILNPFNFESTQPSQPALEVTKRVQGSASVSETWDFTVTYTVGTPSSFTATRNGADCSSEVTDNGTGLKFSLMGGDSIRIVFEADESFRFEVREDDTSQLTNITGMGGIADMADKKFTSSGGTSKVIFTNGEPIVEPPDEPDTPIPTPGDAILYKRDAKTNAGVGPATFKFSSVVNGDYEFDTNANGELETIQWWDPTESVGKYIKPGEYTVTEQIPPPNYTSTSEVKQIKLELDADGNPIPAGPLVYQNLAKVGLRIVKYDRLSHRPLSGVTFEIYRDGASIGRYETNGSGEILLTDIEPGTYLAVEVDTGDDVHLLDSSYQEVELEAGDGIKDLIFFNDVKPGLRLVKVDSSDPNKTISGAVFEVKSVAGDYGPEEFTTNSSGEIDLSKLPEGAYVVTEKSCPGYVIDDAQRIIHLKANDTAEFIFTNTLKPSLRLVKTSADGGPLEGVTFRIAPIEDGSHSLDRTTDAKGEILIEGLEPGIYSVVETDTLPDHILDPTEHHVELSPGRTAELRLSNDRRPNLTIHKSDADTGTPISDTVFLVKTADGHSVQEVKTGTDGTAVVENLLPGVYEISEKSVPSPYLLDAPSQLVTLYPNHDREAYFENHKAPVIEIIKENSITHDRLGNVRFQVWYASNDTETGEYNDLGVFTTDENGRIVLTEPQVPMRDGWYRVKELEPPKGFSIKDSDTQEAFIPAGKSHTFRFENTPLSAIVGWKYDSVSGLAVEGCIFQVRYLGGTSGTGGTVIGTYKTSANGSFTVTGLQAGTYIIEELASDSGHVIDTAPQTVYISGEDQDVVQVYFGNAPKGSLLIRKVCSVNPSVTLQDAEFKVTYADGSVIGESNGIYRSDENGEVRIDGLIPGKSVVVTETRAPDGFLIDTQSQTIVIQAGKTVSSTMKNQPKGQLVLQKRDSVTGQPLAGAEFRITTAAGCEVGLDGVIGTSTLTQNGLFTTDSNGEIRISNLAPGTYVLTETKAPDGYLMDSPSTNVVIGANGDTQTVVVTNTPLGGLLVKKMDAATKEPLSDVVIKITRPDGSVVGTSNGEFRTDERGFISIPDLAPGAYIVQEIKARPGYLLDDTPKSIEIKDHQLYTLELFNQPLGNLVIQKLDGSDRKTPLEGVQFKITYADGSYLPDEGGKLSSNGLYFTNKDGQIVLSGVTGTLVVTEEATIDGYTIDPNTRSQTVVVNPDDTQTLYFYNNPVGGIELIKVNEADKTERIGNVTFEIRRMDDGLVDTITTDKRGRAFLALEDGAYYAVEIEAPKEYKVDPAPIYFEIKDGKTVTKTVTNEPFSGIILHKTDSVTGDGIYDVKFLVYDANKNPIGEYATDDRGYIYIDDLTVQGKGKLFIRELEAAPGYELDKEYKTVYVQPGKTIEVEWKNTPITGQIQVYKYAAEANGITGTAAGTPLKGAVYEIVLERSGKVVDYITTDARGVAASKPLPLGRYKLVEVTAPAYWQVSSEVFDVTLEYPGQIIKLSAYDKPSDLGVSITKRGNASVLAGNSMRYDFTLANTSNVALESFYFHDRIPTDIARATVLTTGTYSARLNYRILYKTNYTASYQVLASNLLTSNNYSFGLNAIPMQAGEYVTDIYFDFGKVPVGFQSVQGPTLSVVVSGTAANGYQMVNRADVGGKYQGTWQTAQASWVTIILKLWNDPTLPKTGY